MIRRLRFLGILPIVGYLAACGESGGATGDTLTAGEVGAIADVLFGLSFLLPSAPPVMLAAAAEPFEETVACAAGGSLGYSGDLTLTEGNESIDLTQSINECVTIFDGVIFTLLGDPNITLKASGDDSNVSFDIRGAFTYMASDGRQGGCGVDLAFTFDPSSESSSGNSSSGSMCGVEATVLLVSLPQPPAPEHPA